jgi:putative ABC transport system ATP-binding protein
VVFVAGGDGVAPGSDAMKPQGPGAELVLAAQGLCKYYPRGGRKSEVRALDNVSLGVERGSLTALTGPSGSGKTTLLALLGALERPTRGRVLFEGRDLGECSDVELTRVRRRMGFVFQDFGLISHLSAAENITYLLMARGLSHAERHQRAEELLARFGMSDRGDARAAELSGGEQQRLALARALAGRPEVVLADEPTSNLDAAAAQVVRTALQEMHAAGTTVVVSTHDAGLLALANRVYELQGGRLTGARGQ